MKGCEFVEVSLSVAALAAVPSCATQLPRDCEAGAMPRERNPGTNRALALGRGGLYDSGWRFLQAVAPVAQTPGFDDSTWRLLHLPHDWSIEDLSPLTNSASELPAVLTLNDKVKERAGKASTYVSLKRNWKMGDSGIQFTGGGVRIPPR